MQAAEAAGIKPTTNSSAPQVNRILSGLMLYIYDSRSGVETLKVNHQSAVLLLSVVQSPTVRRRIKNASGIFTFSREYIARTDGVH